MNRKFQIAMSVAQVCLCLFGCQLVAAESLQTYLTEFRQFPLGITTEEFLHRFPDAHLAGAVYLNKISCPPFDQVTYQFEKGRLIAAILSPGGDSAAEAGWITRWADIVRQAAEEAWGKPDRTIITPAGDSLDYAHLTWTGLTTYLEIYYTTPASLEKLSKPTNRVKPFILALMPNLEAEALEAAQPHLIDRPVVTPLEPPVVTKLAEIPAQYCGTYYLHETTTFAQDGGRPEPEHFLPAKPFGRIEAKQITLGDGKLLKVTEVNQMMIAQLNGGRPQLIVKFEKTDLTWSISERPNSKLTIAQADFNPHQNRIKIKNMAATIFKVSQNKDLRPDSSADWYPGLLPPKSSAIPDAQSTGLSQFSKVHVGYDSGNAMLILELDTPWRKRDLEWCATVIDDDIASRQEIAALLLSAVWSALVENDPQASAKCLHQADIAIGKIETLTQGQPVKSYREFQGALSNAVTVFTIKTDAPHRLQALYDAYPATFPLHNEIMNISHELQALLDNTTEHSPLWDAILYSGSTVTNRPFVPFVPPARANAGRLLKISELHTTNAIAADPDPERSARKAATLHLSPNAEIRVEFYSLPAPLSSDRKAVDERPKETFTTAEAIGFRVNNPRTDAIHVIIAITSQGYRRTIPDMLLPGAGMAFEFHPGELAPGDYIGEVREKETLLARVKATIVKAPDGSTPPK